MSQSLPCPSSPAVATLLTLALNWPGIAFADPADTTRVYRCDTRDGRVEFRQGLCPDGLQQELVVEDRPVGWDAPPLAEKGATPKPKSQGPSPSALAAAKAKAKQQEDCWKAERRLETVNRQLRRGYKPSAGVKLRDRRQEYEAYLERFCGG